MSLLDVPGPVLQQVVLWADFGDLAALGGARPGALAGLDLAALADQWLPGVDRAAVPSAKALFALARQVARDARLDGHRAGSAGFLAYLCDQDLDRFALEEMRRAPTRWFAGGPWDGALDPADVALRASLAAGSLRTARRARALGAGLDAPRAPLRTTPLMEACYRGSQAGVRQLLEWTASLDLVNGSYGQTALHTAMSRGQWACARLLVAARCDGEKRDRDGLTALRLARKWPAARLAMERGGLEQVLDGLCAEFEERAIRRAG